MDNRKSPNVQSLKKIRDPNYTTFPRFNTSKSMSSLVNDSLQGGSAAKGRNSQASPNQMASATKQLPVRKATTPLMKSSNSQNDIKKSSPSTAQATKASLKSPVPPTPTSNSKKTPEKNSSNTNFQGTPQVRRGSYTISGVTAKSDQNQNFLKVDGCNGSKDPSVMAAVNGASNSSNYVESAFQFHIGKVVQNADGQRGILRYFGPVHFLDGLYCGVELESETGSHDGRVDGKRYFKAGFNRATFWPMDGVRLVPMGNFGMASKNGDFDAGNSFHHGEADAINDGALLTDIQPDLLAPIWDESMVSSTATFDMSSSLAFLKCSRFPGMDESMTPEQLVQQLFAGENCAFVREGKLVDISENETNGQSMLDGDFTLFATSAESGSSGQPLNVSTIPKHISNSDLGLLAHKSNADQSVGLSNSKADFNHAAKGFGALGVLVQYLTGQVVPQLQQELQSTKIQLAKTKLELENAQKCINQVKKLVNNGIGSID